jgi:threonine dehydrogenase-like Zn-dependent dehydrogenase
MAGLRHLCANTSGVGVNRPGCFAEFIALPMTNVWRHRVITHRFSYKDFKEGFRVTASGNSGKVILNWEEV